MYGNPVWFRDMRDDIRKTVGGRVEAAMKTARITQQHVADELDISQSQVSRRLAGKLAFDVVELEVVARLCGVPAASFFPAPDEVAA